ncbi:hypothetical protein HY630_00435 [Candidatus Uhrbacteria bacterium]|nr:hypothetical protein [Candidatus Uhrbacteria bacterium]
MFKFLPLFFLTFLSTLNSAAAQSAPTAASGEASAPMTQSQMIEHCEQKHPDKNAAIVSCITNLRFGKLEDAQAAIVSRLDAGEQRDEEILERLDGLGQKVDRLAASQRTQATTSAPQTVATPTTSVTYTRTGGANWAPVAQPTVVSIHNIEGKVPDTLHITDLTHPNARSTCGGVGADLVVFLDHGVPVTNVYAPAGAPTGFLEVYYDSDNNGVPDGTVMALDLESQTDVWITWGSRNDLEIRYLRPGGQIAVAGLPLQTVYHPTQRNETSASGAIACDRDDNARRGGHQAIPAYSLSRMW